MKPQPILEQVFYHDGRGPELQRTVWSHSGRVLVGFEYFNPDDVYEPEHLKHLKLVKVEAYSMASEEVHGNICTVSNSKAAIWHIEGSSWFPLFQQRHLSDCKHYQIMFYDEIYDVICKEIVPGKGHLEASKA